MKVTGKSEDLHTNVYQEDTFDMTDMGTIMTLD